VVPFFALYPQSPVRVDRIADIHVKKGPPPPGAATGSVAAAHSAVNANWVCVYAYEKGTTPLTARRVCPHKKTHYLGFSPLSRCRKCPVLPSEAAPGANTYPNPSI